MDKIVEHWIERSQYDLDTAKVMLDTGRYLYVSYMCQQTVEKMLKAIFVKKKKSFPPKTHNLILLMKELGFEVSEDEYDFFEEVNTFNISTRYPDEQLKFYKLCTAEFTLKKFAQIKSKYQWLKKELNQ